MADKIKAARARAQARSPAKKKKEEDRASWFENHVIVMGGDKEQEDKIKQALKARMAAGYSGG
jgi:hypothetical protein